MIARGGGRAIRLIARGREGGRGDRLIARGSGREKKMCFGSIPCREIDLG